MCILVLILGFKEIILRFNECKALTDLSLSCFLAGVNVPEAENNIPRYLEVIVQDIVLLKIEYDYELMTSEVRIQREGGQGSGPPLENHKLYGFLQGISNWTPPGKSWTPPPGKCRTPSGTLKNDRFL